MQSLRSAFFELSNDMLCIANLEGYFVDVNPAWTRALGWSREELLSRPFVEFVHPEDREKTAAETTRLKLKNSESINFENRYIHKNGHICWIRWQCITSENQLIYAVARNVTELKNESEADLNSRRFIQEILNAIPDPVFVKDKSHRWIYANDAFSEMLGKPFEEYQHKTDHDLFPKEMAEVYWAGDDMVFNSRQPRENEELIQLSSGVHTILTKKSLCRSQTGEDFLVGVIRDVTDRKAAEELANNLFTLIESSSEIFAYCDHKGTPVYVNMRARELLGWDITSRTISDFVSSASYETLINEALPTASHGGTWEGEIELKNLKTGSYLPIWQRVFALRDANFEIKFFATIGTDLTELKRAQMQLMQSSKMASLGEMASGIAHEINNPLSIIQVKVGQISDSVNSGETDAAKLIQKFNSIDRNVKRITKIIKGLRSFSRNGDHDAFVPTRLQTIFDDLLELCRERFKISNIDLRLPEKIKGNIECRPIQISQVLLNLLNNSYDAIQGVPNAWVEVKIEELESMFKLYVTDSGNGIPPEVALKMMQPFYTTKKVGHGVGLGLSIAKGIVEDHMGQLYLNMDSPNTEFIIELPKHQKQVEL